MALSPAKAQGVLVLARTDVQLGISGAARVPAPNTRASALAEIAQLAAGRDPATAGLWAAVAGVATDAKDGEVARDALAKGPRACAALYKLDSNDDDPNSASLKYWPSVQHFRNLLYKAAKVNSTEMGLLLLKINDPDLPVMGRIAIVRSLMGKPSGDLKVGVSWGNYSSASSLR